ncbi:MAG: DUF4392 domain-containing protein [Bacteroidales bacterium]|nr:DUF4392 domain-containing protein [Bacteroidales bacterium]
MGKIEDIILQHDQRGMQQLAKYLNDNYCMNAAQALWQCKKGNILILTGFFVKNQGETDGPLGSIFLYKALKILGFSPIIVSDEYAASYFEGLPFILYTHNSQAEEILENYQPVAIVSIERCGRAADGKYYNMRKNDISLQTAPIDELVLRASCLTIGIGDGGNEIGMGKLSCHMQHIDLIPSIVPCNYLIVASVSNWGSYGLIAALSMLWHKDLLPEEQDMGNYLKYIVTKGAVDGFSGENKPCIDGFDLSVEQAIVKDLKRLITK